MIPKYPGKPTQKDRRYVTEQKAWGRDVVDCLRGRLDAVLPDHFPFQLCRTFALEDLSSSGTGVLTWKIRGGCVQYCETRCIPASVDGFAGDDVRAVHPITDAPTDIDEAFTVYAHVHPETEPAEIHYDVSPVDAGAAQVIPVAEWMPTKKRILQHLRSEWAWGVGAVASVNCGSGSSVIVGTSDDILLPSASSGGTITVKRMGLYLATFSGDIQIDYGSTAVYTMQITIDGVGTGPILTAQSTALTLSGGITVTGGNFIHTGCLSTMLDVTAPGSWVYALAVTGSWAHMRLTISLVHLYENTSTTTTTAA